MKIVGLFIVFTVIILFEVPRLVRNKMWRELGAFSGLTLLAMGMCVITVVRVNMLNPVKLIDVVFSPISNLMISLVR